MRYDTAAWRRAGHAVAPAFARPSRLLQISDAPRGDAYLWPMQRFFFHTADGSRDRDEIGTELPDVAAARVHAIRYAGECLSSEPSVLWDSRDFRVEVTDARNMLLFTVITLAVNAPAVGDVD